MPTPQQDAISYAV